jgi:hypothetical protein
MFCHQVRSIKQKRKLEEEKKSHFLTKMKSLVLLLFLFERLIFLRCAVFSIVCSSDCVLILVCVFCFSFSAEWNLIAKHHITQNTLCQLISPTGNANASLVGGGIKQRVYKYIAACCLLEWRFGG